MQKYDAQMAVSRSLQINAYNFVLCMFPDHDTSEGSSCIGVTFYEDDKGNTGFEIDMPDARSAEAYRHMMRGLNEGNGRYGTYDFVSIGGEGRAVVIVLGV